MRRQDYIGGPARSSDAAKQLTEPLIAAYGKGRWVWSVIYRAVGTTVSSSTGAVPTQWPRSSSMSPGQWYFTS